MCKIQVSYGVITRKAEVRKGKPSTVGPSLNSRFPLVERVINLSVLEI